MNTPKEFTEDQWNLTIDQTISRMGSVVCESFGAQFFILYLMQNLTVQLKSMQTVCVSVVAMVGSILLLMPFIRKHSVKLAYPLIILGTTFGVICDLLIIEHPVAVIFIMAIVGGLIRGLEGGSWSVLLNRCFQGDAKSSNGFWVGAGATLGVCFGSLLVFLFADMDLKTVVYIDIVLTIIDCGLTCGRIYQLKKFLVDHPYEQK